MQINPKQVVGLFIQLYTQDLASRITARLAQFDEMNDKELTDPRIARAVGRALVACFVEDKDKSPINPALHKGSMEMKTFAHVITCNMDINPSEPREEVNAVGNRISLKVPMEMSVSIEVRKRTGADDIVIAKG